MVETFLQSIYAVPGLEGTGRSSRDSSSGSRNGTLSYRNATHLQPLAYIELASLHQPLWTHLSRIVPLMAEHDTPMTCTSLQSLNAILQQRGLRSAVYFEIHIQRLLHAPNLPKS